MLTNAPPGFPLHKLFESGTSVAFAAWRTLQHKHHRIQSIRTLILVRNVLMIHLGSYHKSFPRESHCQYRYHLAIPGTSKFFLSSSRSFLPLACATKESLTVSQMSRLSSAHFSPFLLPLKDRGRRCRHSNITSPRVKDASGRIESATNSSSTRRTREKRARRFRSGIRCCGCRRRLRGFFPAPEGREWDGVGSAGSLSDDDGRRGPNGPAVHTDNKKDPVE